MVPLLVTAFFDIGRGDWQGFARSSGQYLTSFERYFALLPAKKYILCPEHMRDAVAGAVDYFDAAELSELPSYRFLGKTRSVMDSAEFKDLIRRDDNSLPQNPECCIPEYNVLVLAKWDALERAFAATRGEYSHYIWADFGLGRRAKQRPYLPPPVGVSPVERDKIVISAQHDCALPAVDRHSIAEQVRNLRDQVATSLMIVPARHVVEFSSLARGCYQSMLDMGLTSDDQVVVDMCVCQRPDLFHLSYPPVGLSKYNHIHNVLNGLDTAQTVPWLGTFWHGLAHRIMRPIARARIGL